MKIISVEAVHKRFILRRDRPRSIVDGVRNVFRRTTREDFWALKGVSFAVNEGEAIGLIGHNGAGKSTVLKILTGIMDPTKGVVRTRGRVSALIEVGAGFHPEMTGRENIYLNGAILGMTRQEIDRKLDAIIDFSEIEEFIDTPVKRYSSGMYARLGFSVAAHVEPRILLVDEVLAVGDLAFQQKCLSHMQNLASKGCAIILVTHSIHSAKQICSRLVWIHEGQVRVAGPADQVAQEYQTWASRHSARGQMVGTGVRWGAGGALIHSVEVEAKPSICHMATDVDVTLDIEVDTPISDPLIWVMLANSDGQKIAGTTTRRQAESTAELNGRDRVCCSFYDVPLLPGAYRVMAGVFDQALVPLDRWGDCASFVVEPREGMGRLVTPDFDGSVYAKSRWECKT